MKTNQNLAQITESFTIQLADRVRRLTAEGVPVIGLQTGDPDFNTPQPIIDAAHQAMLQGKTHYANSRGLPELRSALSAYVEQRTGRRFDPNSEMLITHGGTHAYHCALAAILNPGDEVLVPAASWQTHANMVRVLRGRPIQIKALPENDFLPTLEEWESQITDRTAALVLNTPSNPTGAVASQAYMQALLDLAKTHNLYLISDEVYDHLLYDGAAFTSAASLAGGEDHIILVNSFSKTYAMTGWRMGYLCAPAAIISSALKESQHTITNVAEFVQIGGLTAVTSPEVAASVEAMRAAYAERRAQVMAAFAQRQPRRVGYITPYGAFYFFLDLRPLGMPSLAAAEKLLNDARVAVVPGLAYGSSGEGFIRVTIAADVEHVLTGVNRIIDWAEAQ
ncbi:pyridoxal phosphate-dependent aminotransferase [Aggregatilineales bacterium SYSU G02658]